MDTVPEDGPAGMDALGKRKLDPYCFYSNRTATSVEQDVVAIKKCSNEKDNYWALGKMWVEPDKVADSYKVWYDYTGYDWPDKVPTHLIRKVKSVSEIDDMNLKVFDRNLLGKQVMVKPKDRFSWETGVITGSQKKKYLVMMTGKGRRLKDTLFKPEDVRLILE